MKRPRTRSTYYSGARAQNDPHAWGNRTYQCITTDSEDSEETREASPSRGQISALIQKVTDLQNRLQCLEQQTRDPQDPTPVQANNATQQPPISIFLNYKLNGQENYQSWATDIMTLARVLNVSDHFEKDSKTTTQPHLASLAQSLIMLNISHQLKPTINLTQDPSTIWEKLKNDYGTCPFIHYLDSWDKLRKLQFQPGDDVDLFRSEFFETASILSQHEADVPSKAYMAIFILSIQQSYKKVGDELESVLSLPNSSERQPTIEYCFRQLQETVTRDRLAAQPVVG